MPTTTDPVTQVLSQLSLQSGTLQKFQQTALTVYFSNLAILEFASLIISAALIAAVIWIAMKTGWYATRMDRIQNIILKKNTPKKQTQNSWKKVQTHFFAGDDNDLKIAVMEADQVLETALKNAGVKGVNLGDRLKNLKREQVPNLDDIWQAHKLRNQIAHEPGFKLKRDLAERALSIYEKALQNLGALE